MNRNLNIKIAYWYYELGMTQDEIAKRLKKEIKTAIGKS